jgi:hypothetical protein
MLDDRFTYLLRYFFILFVYLRMNRSDYKISNIDSIHVTAYFFFASFESSFRKYAIADGLLLEVRLQK